MPTTKMRKIPASVRLDEIFPVDLEAENGGADVLVSANGKQLWVNVDGRCVLRVRVPKGIIKIDDDRVVLSNQGGTDAG